MNAAAAYRKLSKLRAFQKKALPFVVSTVDIDILLAIGLAQERGRKLGTTDLFTAGFAPTATISRHLRRLKVAGAVTEQRCSTDARRIELQLSRAASNSLCRLVRLRG